MLAAYLALYAAALVITLVVLKLLQKLAPLLGLVDAPAGRKIHLGAVPLIGGIGIGLGTAITVAAVAMLAVKAGPVGAGLDGHIGFLIGSVALAVLGAVDDFRPVPARIKLAVQTLCCAVAVYLDGAIIGGVDFYIGGTDVIIGPMLLGPFTILVMLTILNGINMIDGVDGLASGLTIVGLILMTKASIAANYTFTASYLCVFIGATTAFILLNFPFWPGRRAKIFLGDSGSLLLGFALAYLAVKLSSLPHRVFKPSTTLWFFFIPVADAIWIYLRRYAVSRAPFMAGRDHFHHQVMKFLPAYAVTWLLVGSTALMAGLAYLAERLKTPPVLIVLVWIIAFLAFGWITQHSWKRAWLESRRTDQKEDDEIGIQSVAGAERKLVQSRTGDGSLLEHVSPSES